MKKIDSTKRYEILRERMGNGDVDRRTFMGLLGAAGITTGVSGGIMVGMAQQARAAGTTLNFETKSSFDVTVEVDEAGEYDLWGKHIPSA